MILLEYSIIILIYSAPWLAVVLFAVWFVLKEKLNHSSRESLIACSIALLNFLALSLLVWQFWPLKFGGPVLFPFGLGPAIAAGILIFPTTIWWHSRNAT